MFINYEICLINIFICFLREKNPRITRAKSFSSELSPHKRKIKSSNALDGMCRRLKRTQEINQLLLTQEKYIYENIDIEKQDEYNAVDELKYKNCALEEQIDDLEIQVQSLQKGNQTLEYAKRSNK